MRNYYEKLVIETLNNLAETLHITAGLQEDIACLALNKLPPRYYRNEIDLTFFLTDKIVAEMLEKVNIAVEAAMDELSAELNQSSANRRTPDAGNSRISSSSEG